MTKRTRYFMFGSALVVLVGLCTGLVAYYNGDASMRSGSGPVDMTYLPADASAVAFANVHDIMNSEFRQKLKQVLPTGEEKDKMLAETGIDIERDIDTVVAAFAGGLPAQNGAVVLLRGRFNQPQIEMLANQHGGTVEDYKGKRLVLGGNLPNPHQDMATSGAAPHAQLAQTTACVGFIEPGLLALGDSAAVKRAIDAHASGVNVTQNADIMKFVGTVDSASNAWVIGRSDQASKVASLPQQVTDQLAAIQWFALSARVDGGVTGVLRAEARDDKAAEDLRAVVTGGLAAAHLVMGKDPKVDAVLNSLQMSGTGKTVELGFTVPPEILDLVNGVAGLKNLTSGRKKM